MKKLSKEILAILSLLISVVILRWKSLLLFSTHYLGGVEGDAGLYVWLVKSFHADPLSAFSFSAPAFYPYDVVRAWSDTFILPSCLFSLFSLAGLPDPAAYNLVILAASFLNGISCYFLSKFLGATRVAAVASGVCYLSLPYLTTHLGHPQLQFAFFIPFAISTTLIACAHPSFKKWFLVSLNISGAFLTSANYAVMCVLIVGVLIFLELFQRSLKISILLHAKTIAALLCGILPCLPALCAYAAVSFAFDKRKLYESFAFQLSPVSYLSYAPLHYLGSLTSTLSHSSEGWLGSGLCLGIFVSACALQNARRVFLASCLLILSFGALSYEAIPEAIKTLASWLPLVSAYLFIRSDISHKNILALGCLFFSLSCGPVQIVLPHFPSPFSTLYYLVPGVGSIRAVGRFGITPLLCFCVLPFTMRRQTSSMWLLLATLILFENTLQPYPLEPLPQPPPIFEALKEVIRPDDAVLILPLAGETENRQIKSWSQYALLNTRYMNWSVEAGIKKLVNGYSGQRPRLFERLPYYLEHFPDVRSLEEASQIGGLRYILQLPPADTMETLPISAPNYLQKLSGSESTGILYRFFPKVPIGPKPTYVAVYHGIKTFNAKLIFALSPSDRPCHARFGIAEHTEQTALANALIKSPLVNIAASSQDWLVKLDLPVSSSVLAVRPMLVAIDSNCGGVLDLSPSN